MASEWIEIDSGVWRRDTSYIVAVRGEHGPLYMPFTSAPTNRVFSAWYEPTGTDTRPNLANLARDGGFMYNKQLVPAVYSRSVAPRMTATLCCSGYMQSIGGGNAKYDSLLGLALAVALLQARGYFGALVRVVRCVNMTYSAKPMGRIPLRLDLAAFKAASVHGANMVYKPDVMPILRVLYVGPGAETARNTIRINIFTNGEMLIAGPDETIFPAVAAWLFRLVTNEYVRQYGAAALEARLAGAAERGYVIDARDPRAAHPTPRVSAHDGIAEAILGSDSESDEYMAGATSRRRRRKRARRDSDSDSDAENAARTARNPRNTRFRDATRARGAAGACASVSASRSGSGSASGSESDSGSGSVLASNYMGI